MKTKYLLLLFLFVTSINMAQTKLDTIIVEKSYARSKKRPLKVGTGVIIINNSDSLYLVNQIRYNYYQELRKLVNDNIDKDIENIVLKYEKILKEDDVLFNQLEIKCKEQAELYEESIADLKKSLSETDRTLNLTQKSLDNANTAIELGIKQISNSQKKRFWKNFGLIGGGVSIGLIVGLLIAN